MMFFVNHAKNTHQCAEKPNVNRSVFCFFKIFLGVIGVIDDKLVRLMVRCDFGFVWVVS